MLTPSAFNTAGEQARMRCMCLSKLWVWVLLVLFMIAACSPAASVPALETMPGTLDLLDLGEVQVRGADGMRMVLVPAGSFMMGSTIPEYEAGIQQCRQYYNICNLTYYSREAPLHQVSLSAYWIDQTEVTREQYSLCVKQGGCQPLRACDSRHSSLADGDTLNHPIVCVDWAEASSYCAWAGGRLPTEAEWEYAFRGPEGLIYPWGNVFDGQRLNYCDRSCPEGHADQTFSDGHVNTAPVGSYPEGATWVGALDMAGNVWEWVGDWFGPYEEGEAFDPTGPEIGIQRIIRGGSWFYHPARTRGAARDAVPPDTRFDSLGFRCVIPLADHGGS